MRLRECVCVYLEQLKGTVYEQSRIGFLMDGVRIQRPIALELTEKL